MKFETGFYWMQFSCLSLSHYEASNLLCPGKFTYLDEHVPVLVFCYLLCGPVALETFQWTWLFIQWLKGKLICVWCGFLGAYMWHGSK